jgi:hypothetical protein
MFTAQNRGVTIRGAEHEQDNNFIWKLGQIFDSQACITFCLYLNKRTEKTA